MGVLPRCVWQGLTSECVGRPPTHSICSGLLAVQDSIIFMISDRSRDMMLDLPVPKDGWLEDDDLL